MVPVPEALFHDDAELCSPPPAPPAAPRRTASNVIHAPVCRRPTALRDAARWAASLININLPMLASPECSFQFASAAQACPALRDSPLRPVRLMWLWEDEDKHAPARKMNLANSR